MKLREILRSIFFSRNLTCSVCGRESFSGDTVCEGCKSVLPYNDSAICDHCGRRTVYPTEYCDFCKGKQSYLELCRSAFVYEEPIGQVIRRLKYNGEKYLAEEFAEYLKKCFLKDMRYADGIVCVPTSQKRIKERGYNQSFLLAKELAKKMTKQVATTSMMGAIINIVVNVGLIKVIGLYAAAFSTMISYFIMMVYRHFDLKKYLNINRINKIILLLYNYQTFYIKNSILIKQSIIKIPITTDTSPSLVTKTKYVSKNPHSKLLTKL